MFRALYLIFFVIALNAYAIDDERLRLAIQSELDSLQHVYKVSYQNSEIASHLKAVYHNALLAMDDEKQFLTLSLSPQDLVYFDELGLIPEPALEFQLQRTEQLNATLARLDAEAASSPLSYSVSGGSVVGGSVVGDLFVGDLVVDDSVAPNLQQAVTISGIPGYPCYPTVEETFAVANDLAASYPTLAQMIDIGDSWEKINLGGGEGYDLWVMKITNVATDAAFPNKPKLFIHSAMHAREYTTAALTLDFASKLLNEYDSNADVEWIVDYHEVHILFHMNPDGRKIAEAGVFKRKNNNTDACINPANGYGFGIDLNRNFSFFWKKREADYNYGAEYRVSDDICNETYRGLTPASEPETQAVEVYVRDLFADRRGEADEDAASIDTAGLHLDIHSFGNLVLFPYAHTFDSAPNGNELQRLARRLAYFNNYVPQQSPNLYLLDGNSESVSYGELGVAHLTFELGSRFFETCDQYIFTIKPDNLDALMHAAKLAAAPYQLPAGPYFENFVIKGREEADVTLGADVVVSMEVADNLFNSLNGVEGAQTVTSVEYSVDQHFYEPLAQPAQLSLTGYTDDEEFDESLENVTFRLETSGGQYLPGRHTVYLRATDSEGGTGAVAARHFNIISSSYLEADIQYECTNNSCRLDASRSIDTDGDIVSYWWDFGDGNYSSEIDPSYFYRASGDYQITLTITGEDGETASASVNHNFALVGQPPEAHVSYHCSGLSCEFDARMSFDPDDDIRVRRWRFGDGTARGGEVVAHTYAVAGQYGAVFILVDAAGWRVETELDVEVREELSDQLWITMIQVEQAQYLLRN